MKIMLELAPRFPMFPRRALTLVGLLLLPPVHGVEAQRGERVIALPAPEVRLSATPLMVTLGWRQVDGAVSYTVEQATNLGGPWVALPPVKETQITAPVFAGAGNGYGGGILYYYRVSALPSLGEPGVTVVALVIPRVEFPLGVGIREDGADLWVTWEPVRFATGYVVTLAPGQQLAPSHTVEVGAQATEARLINVASPNLPKTVWIAVNTRYGTALSSAAPVPFALPAVQQCWPPSSSPGSPPQVSVVPGPTSVWISVPSAKPGGSTARVERTPMGTQLWQNIGCKAGPVLDASLASGTQYQYRVTEVWPTGQVGQALVVGATGVAPDNQAPAATVSNCTTLGCQVTLKWLDYAGTDGVRIESSYGLSQVFATSWSGRLWTGPTAGSPPTPVHPSIDVFLPKGTYTFSLTNLYRPMRPGPKPPGRVTVAVMP